MPMKRSVLLAAAFLSAALGAASASAGDYLVYDPGGDSNQNHVVAAMTKLGFSFDVVSAATGVSAGAISSHKALIIGFTVGGNYSALAPELFQGITGNTILTGHDADFHTWDNNSAASTLMSRYVSFVGGSVGKTGLLAFPDFAGSAFSWLPEDWGVSATGALTRETITSITPQGTASGFYGGLTTASLSNWNNSYHAYFNTYDSAFQAFEIGAEGYAVTIGTTVTPVYIGYPEDSGHVGAVPEPETYAMMLAGLGLMTVVARRRKHRMPG